MNGILRITDPILSDDSIDKYEDVEYEPVAGTNLNSSGADIRLAIETQDIFTHPSESFLIIEGRLLKADGTPYDPANLITLTNNGIMHLFKRIRYDLSGQEIENIMNVGQVTTMLGLLKYPDDFSKSKGLNQLWYKDTTIRADNENGGFNVRRTYIFQADPVGSFSFKIPLKHIFGFCEDYDFSKSKGLNQLWYKDTTIRADNENGGFNVRRTYIFQADPVGSFSFKIPLKHIFGFCEDYDKVVYGLKHNLTLTRNNDNDAIFKSAALAVGGRDNVADGQVRLSKVSWFMPHVTPADKVKMELYKIIERKEKIPVGYRMIQCDSATIPHNSTSFSRRLSVKSSPEVPRFIIVGFQTNKSGNQKRNPSVFDSVNISNIYVMLNSMRYPTADYNISFDKQQFSRVYGDTADFRSKFFNMDELVSSPNINPSDYRTLYPLFLFDVSKQSEKLKYSTTDIQVKMFFSDGIPLNTQVYGVIISDRLINFQSDGNKFSVVF